MSSTTSSSAPPDKPLHEFVPYLIIPSPLNLLTMNRLLTTSLVDIYVGPENTHWVLHEKLLCHHSPFFRARFYNKEAHESASSKTYGLPDSDDLPFELFVGWLYSRALRYPEAEKDVGPLLDLYFLSEQFQIAKLSEDVVETVRAFYHNNESYPGLRRVQYVYANTDEDNIMREMMVNSIARYLTLSDVIPQHWENALKKNGQLSVDIIRSIQQWHLEGRSVPDARDASVPPADRGRGSETKLGFSKVEEGSSMQDHIKKEEDESAEGSQVNGSS
ncbi:hypothetical protein P7C71_g139, partial [Lecanoromycetidae sp. Uapishka_2]